MTDEEKEVLIWFLAGGRGRGHGDHLEVKSRLHYRCVKELHYSKGD